MGSHKRLPNFCIPTQDIRHSSIYSAAYAWILGVHTQYLFCAVNQSGAAGGKNIDAECSLFNQLDECSFPFISTS